MKLLQTNRTRTDISVLQTGDKMFASSELATGCKGGFLPGC